MKLCLVIGHSYFVIHRFKSHTMLFATTLLAAQLWYIVPLILSVSLVYGATRHELPRPILYHAWHTAVWMAVFMGGIFVVLWLVSLFV
jgi:hypothetical protein